MFVQGPRTLQCQVVMTIPPGGLVFSGTGMVIPCDLDQQVSSLPGVSASLSIKWENNCYSSNFTELLVRVITRQLPAGMAIAMRGRS